MFPSGALATPDAVLEQFPAILEFAHVIETDENREVLWAVSNLSAMRTQHNIDPALTEAEAIEALQDIINAPPEPEVPNDPLATALLALADAIGSDPELTTPHGLKIKEVGEACAAAIYGGIAIGGSNYSLTEHDQIEIMTQMSAIKEGADMVPYHADGELCRMFDAEEFAAIADAARNHIYYHRTYSNHLRAWIRRSDAAELDSIFYGAELPPDLAESMAAMIGGAGA